MYCTDGLNSTCMEAALITCDPLLWAACRRWGGGRPCLPSDRSTCPCPPGRWPRSGRCAPPRRSSLPGAACRRRVRAGSPSAHRPHAGCRSACDRGPTCCARTPPTAATRFRCSCRFLLRRLLARMRKRGFAHPRAFVPCLLARGQALAVARAIAGDDALEFIPVDRAEVMRAACLVPLEVGIRQRDAEDLGLVDAGIDEALAQRVV